MDPIIQQAATGNLAALGRIYDEHAEALLDSATAVTLSLRQGLLATEHVFRSFKHLVRAERPDAAGLRKLLFRELRAWIAKTAPQRNQGERHFEPLLAAASMSLPETAVSKTEDALRALREPEREVIAYKVWGGLSLAEVAELTKERFDMVEKRYREGIQRAKDILSPPESEPEDPEIWFKRVKFKHSASGLKMRVVKVVSQPSAGGKKFKIVLIVLVLLAAGLTAAYYALDAAQMSKIRQLLGLPE